MSHPDNFQHITQLKHDPTCSIYLSRRSLPSPLIVISKIFHIATCEEEGIDPFHEAKMMQVISHENCISLLESFTSPDGADFWLIIEYIPCDSLLFALEHSEPSRLPEKTVARVINQVLQALVYLHQTACIVHRDIKPSNFLYSQSGLVKVADLGIAIQFSINCVGEPISPNQQLITPTISQLPHNTQEFIGSLRYMAPEIARHEPYAYPVDIWCIGMSVLEMLLGDIPYATLLGQNFSAMSLPSVIQQTSFSPLTSLCSSQDIATFSPDVIDFISQCCQNDPTRRPTATELLTHPFVAKAKSNLSLIKLANSMGPLLKQQRGL